MKMVKRSVVCFVVCALMFGQFAAASSSWTDARTYKVPAGGSFVIINTTGKKLGDTKTTDRNEWSLNTISKTMITTPKAKLVNGKGNITTDIIDVADEGGTVSGNKNFATKGYTQYLAVKSSAFQVSPDYIKLRFKNY